MTAAAARKLQKEVDVVLKKVDDGIDEFASVWEQANNASGAQREKLGEDLKRSINKLQRLRAQVREWIQNGDMKSGGPKDKLEDARRRIENDMQRFKDFERELKTKAFSTCALSKSGDDLELEEMEKIKYQDWLTSNIQVLSDQLDELEADLEVLGNKKTLNAQDKSEQSRLKTCQERHRWHVNKLEQVLRALDNNALDMSDLAVVRDFVELYIENHQDPDYGHDEALYDCFDLAEYEEKQKQVLTPSSERRVDESASSKEEPSRKGKEKERKKKDEKKDKKKDKAAAAGGTPAEGATTPGSAKSGKPPASPSLHAQDKTPSGLKSPMSEDGKEKKGVLDDINLDEVKVQEEQLLSEAEEFICKICQIHVVGCSPKLTNCSHLFCGDCIAQWFAQHPESQTWAQRARAAGPERVVPCPVCKQPLNEKKDLYPVCGATSRSENLLLWRMLSSLKIMCINHSKLRPDGKCDWIGEYGEYQKHALTCKNDGLGSSGVAAPSAAEPSAAPAAARGPALAPEAPAPATPKAPAAPAASSPQAAAPQSQPAPQPRPAPQPQAPAPQPQAPAPQPQPQAPAPAPQAPARAQPAAAASPQAPAPQALAAPATAAPATAATTPAATAASAQPAAATPSPAPAQAAADPDACPYVARAVTGFEPSGATQLHLQAGDMVHVLERHSSGWSYCRSIRPPAASGWVPAWAVQRAPEQPSTDEAAAPAPAANPAAVAPERQRQPAQATAQPSPVVAAAPVTPQAQSQPVTPKAPTPKSVVRAAASSYKAASPSQLSLSLNDLVEIIERHTSGWTYGRKVDTAPPLEGWFPDWVCAQK